MKILHLTTILPAPISTKTHENDILMRLAVEYEKKYPGSNHHFILIVPYSNWFFELFRKKWKEYRQIISKGSFVSGDYTISVVGMPGFKRDIRFRKLLACLGYMLFSKRIEKTIGQFDPDIIHAHNMHSNIELAELIRKKYGVNYLVSARSIHHRVLNRIRKGELKPVSIISYNQISAEQCKGLGVPVEIIPHPVDNYFLRDEAPVLIPNKQRLKIVSVCTLVKRKNIDRVIRALHKTNSSFSYTIIGDGPEKRNLEMLASTCRIDASVIFHGPTSHEAIARMFGQFDLYVMPSYPETLGRVFLEALACGLPVIAAKNTGIDGFIEHKVHGYLVDHNSVDEIKEAILHFMALSPGNKLKMRRNAMDFASKFTWDAILEKYSEVYGKKVIDFKGQADVTHEVNCQSA